MDIGLTARPGTHAAAVAIRFAEHGCAILEQVFPPSFIDELRETFVARYGSLTAGEMQARCSEAGWNEFYEVGDGRYEIAPTMSGPFGDPRLYANDFILGALDAIFGDIYKVSSLTVVISYPGSPMQHVHRDHSHLFERDAPAIVPA